MPAKRAPAPRPEAARIDIAWQNVQSALDRFGHNDSNVQSWPAQAILESAIRRLRAVDPHFTRRPSAA